MSRHMEHLHCRFHPNASLIEDYSAGDMICSQCGLVVGERMIDVSSEWRDFGNDSDSKNMSRVGGIEKFLFDNNNLETIISKGTKAAAFDEQGKPKYSMKFSQISSTDKALKSGYDAIQMLAGHIHLKKNIIDRACLTYKRCHEKNFLRGRSQELIVAACVYTACRQEDIPRTIKDICAFSMLPVPDVNKTYLNIKKLLPHSAAPKPMTIGNLVPGFCNQLGLDQNFLLRKTAVHIANCANELDNVQGRAPRSIAAAAIYMACSALDIKKSKKEIQEQLNVSESVIRNVYKLMLPNATQLFPKDFVSQRSIASLPRA